MTAAPRARRPAQPGTARLAAPPGTARSPTRHGSQSPGTARSPARGGAVQRQLRRTPESPLHSARHVRGQEGRGGEPESRRKADDEQRAKGNLMPVNPADRPVAARVLRSHGMRRLSAVTAGVGVAGVLATGAIAFTLPGASHKATSTGSTGSTASSGSTSRAASNATSGSSSATSSRSAANGANSSASTSASGSSGRTDATSGGS